MPVCSGRRLGCRCSPRDNRDMATCPRCSAPLADGARFCSTCAAPVEPEPAVKERKLATVLFADLVGSTELGGSLDPEHTRDLLDRFYDAMAAEIALGGGHCREVHRRRGRSRLRSAGGAGGSCRESAGRGAVDAAAAERAVRRAARASHRCQHRRGSRRPAAGRQLLRHGRSCQCRGPARASSATRTDPRRRENGRRRPLGLRVRRADVRPGEGEAGRRRVP